MRIALGHDRRLMPQQPLHLIEIYSCLNHPRRKRVAEIMEMQILDLRGLERAVQASSDVAPIKWRPSLAMKHQIGRGLTDGVFLY